MEFNELNLHAALVGMEIGTPLHFFQHTASTNTVAFDLAKRGAPEGTAVIADSQTEGKGRLKRQWESPAGLNLYTSVILKPTIASAFCPSITLMAGVAVAELLSSYCPGAVHLKWPNDVYINHKKISGILTEMKMAGKNIDFIILGVGININTTKKDFSSLLGERATSLREEKGTDVSRLEIALLLFEKIAKYYKMLLAEGFGPIRERWLYYYPMIDKYCEVTLGGEISRGKIAGIDDLGALLMITEQGEIRRVLAGDAAIMKG